MIKRLLTSLLGRTPLGWLQLSHRPMRLVVASTAISFGTIMVLMQWGFTGAISDGAGKTIGRLKADIIVMSPDANDMSSLGTIPRRRLYQALGVAGVRDGSALHYGSISFRAPDTRESKSLLVLGIDTDREVLSDPLIAQQSEKLRLGDTMLLDRLSRGDFKAAIAAIERKERPTVEISGRTIAIDGLFQQGASFEADGVVVTSDQTFLRLIPRRSGGAISAALIDVAPGYEPEFVAAALRTILPSSDTKVMTRDAFASAAILYQNTKRPTGIILGFSMLLAFVIGTAIVYLILSSDVADHLAEYATFKAMGYTHGYLLGIVFEEAVILAVLGFLPGLVVSLGLYALLAAWTGIPLVMPVSRATIVFVFTLSMCCISGAVATRKLSAADPADIFG